MYLYIYVCMYMHIYICVYMTDAHIKPQTLVREVEPFFVRDLPIILHLLNKHTHTHTHTHSQTHTHTHWQTYRHTHAHTRAYTHTQEYTGAAELNHKYIQIYMHIYHTNSHATVQIWSQHHRNVSSNRYIVEMSVGWSVVIDASYV